jgi:alpha-beta hydrolase superfamily lysophospholipase
MDERLHGEHERSGSQGRPVRVDAATDQLFADPGNEGIFECCQASLELRGPGRLPVQDPVDTRIAPVCFDSCLDEYAHRRLQVRRRLGLVECPEHDRRALGEVPVGKAVQKSLFVGEPLVQRTDRNAGTSGDASGGSCGEPVLGELLGCSVHERSDPPPRTFLLGCPHFPLHIPTLVAIIRNMNDPHVERYRPWMPAEFTSPLVDPASDWFDLPGGTTLHVHRHPAPDEPTATIVILHGGGGHGRMLAPLGVLAQHLGAEALAPDLPGYGHTVVPDRRAVRYEDWVVAVAQLATQVAVPGRPLVLVGASMGGRLALDVAHRLGPGVVQTVVATCLLDPRRTDTAAVVAKHELLVRFGLPLLQAFRRLIDRRLLPIRWLAPIDAIANDPELAHTCATDPLGAGVSVPLGFLRSWLDHNPGYEPATFQACPVVLAHPGDDRWTPLDVSRSFLDEMTVPTELVLLEGCGHFPVEPGAGPGFRTALEQALRTAASA